MKKTKIIVSAIVGLFAIILMTAGSAQALIGPDQDLSDFPPWIWPVIRPVGIFTKVMTNMDVTFKQAAQEMKETAFFQCKCFAAGDYSFKEILTMVDAQFTMELAAVNFARTKSVGLGMGDMAMFDDDDWCGTPPKPPTVMVLVCGL